MTWTATEWNTAALGPTKYKLADTLIRRLRDRFAPGGFLHHGMGKWYPGESLPRWALGLYWRKDGEPIWRDHGADRRRKCVRQADQRSTRARSFSALAERLGVNPEHALPGYEDTWYYLWKERRLPVNVDPFENKLENAEDRARLAQVFERGLETRRGLRAAAAARILHRWQQRVGERRMVLPSGANVSWFPAIRRWASACRWIRFPG